MTTRTKLAPTPLDEVMESMITNQKDSVLNRSKNRPVLLVFLRHFGCTFCREALSDLSKKQESFHNRGLDLVFVHMSNNETAERYFERFEFKDAVHVSDPDCEYYIKFGLTKGTFTQLFGLNTWIRGFSAGVVSGHGVGSPLGDSFQMPGIFIIRDGEIEEKFIHKLASERPDYEQLVSCCSI